MRSDLISPRDVIACALTRPDNRDPSPQTYALADVILKALDDAKLAIVPKWEPPSSEVSVVASPPFDGHVYWFRGTG